jgi:hypothetical protein
MIENKTPSLKDRAPWKPPQYDLADIVALQALLRGEANPEQQKRFVKWLVESACSTYQPSYRSNNPYDTAFAEGRRAVGLNIVTMSVLNVSTLRSKQDEISQRTRRNR